MTLQKTLRLMILLVLMLVCQSCGTSAHKNKLGDTIIIEAKPTTFSLYYSDFINPIRIIPIRNTEADGIILEKKFEYGKNVTKDQLLFVIVSQQLAKDYFEAVRQYVKATDSLATAQYQMEGEEYLKKLKIVSQQEYNTMKSQLFNAKLDYADSLSRLTNVLRAEGTDISVLEQIHGKDPETIYKTLTKIPKSNLFEVRALQSGVTLIPSGEGGESTKKPLQVGSLVKSGQELLSIGDMSGISITVKIPENYIDKIKEGQKTIITGDALPGVTLEGKVTAVGRQSVSTEGGSNVVPSYAVTVVVPRISQHIQDKIRVGMSANVEFRLENPPVITIPLTAVSVKEGQSYVKKIDPASGKLIDVPVETGRTSLDSIEIISGLRDKDEVLLHAAAH